MILAAAAALVLCACAKVETVKITPDEAVSFGVYASNATKAVSATDYSTITTATLKNSTNGFGVFGYYTDAADYGSATKANFMYNQQVTWDGASKWTYSPVKYWPNEHGATATSTDTDKLTFLAYAPFVENLAINGESESTVKDDSAAAATEGIIAMTGNKMAEDAKITFKVPATAENQIDLLFGVMANTYTDVEGNTIGTAGDPLENLTKQKTDGKVEILFKHALAKFVIDIKDVVDDDEPTTSVNPASDNTKVVVKSVKLNGANIGTQGKLNLYTGAWNLTTSSAEYSVPLPSDISVADAPTTYPTIAGVVEGGLASNKIELMLIPATATTTTVASVEIVYYVCTKDTNLDGQVSVVENKISKTFDIDPSTAGDQPLEIVMGKQYNLNLLLGLTSIELDASVEEWGNGGTYNVDLPKNVE